MLADNMLNSLTFVTVDITIKLKLILEENMKEFDISIGGGRRNRYDELGWGARSSGCRH